MLLTRSPKLLRWRRTCSRRPRRRETREHGRSSMRSHSRSLASITGCGLRSPAGWVILLTGALAAGLVPRPALAQEKKDQAKAAGVFDDDEKKPAEAK